MKSAVVLSGFAEERASLVGNFAFDLRLLRELPSKTCFGGFLGGFAFLSGACNGCTPSASALKRIRRSLKLMG